MLTLVAISLLLVQMYVPGFQLNIVWVAALILTSISAYLLLKAESKIVELSEQFLINPEQDEIVERGKAAWDEAVERGREYYQASQEIELKKSVLRDAFEAGREVMERERELQQEKEVREKGKAD
jgi:hypothetical protein